MAGFVLAFSILCPSPDSETNSIIKMIYATLSCTGASRDRNYLDLKLRGADVRADTKGWSKGDRKRILRKRDADGEETRDIYQCRVRCEMVPRVTGIRFPGAAGPCRGTRPSFTWRTSLDLIHAPLRDRQRPARSERSLCIRGPSSSTRRITPIVDIMPSLVSACPVCSRSSCYREPKSFPPSSRYRKIVPSIISRSLAPFIGI